MPDSLIGTPLPQRHRSLAPSPSPGPASTSTPQTQQSRSAALFASVGRNVQDGKPSPQLKLSRPVPGSAHKGPSFSPLSPTLTASPSFAGSNFGGSTYGGDEVALKAEVARSIARSRIVADAGITSCFKREEDEELFNLFCR